jgi:UDP-N-acetyl-D-mannosaminuronic acid transferase (WecB/TagA/CpsF family)
MKDLLPSIKILGTDITLASQKDILEYITKKIKKRTGKFYIVTPNPEIIMHATRSKTFQSILNGASISIPDGVGVPMAGRILRKQIIGRITGVDLMEELCRESALQGFTVGFLGGRGNVAELTAECLVKKYPHLKVSFVGEEWDCQKLGVRSQKLGHESRGLVLENRSSISESQSSVSENRVSISENRGPVFAPPPSDNPRSLTLPAGARRGSPSASHPEDISQFPTPNFQLSTPSFHIDILFVAFGFPKQEEWIAKNLPKIDVTVAMGVGGAFDYISGKVYRAPKFVRRVGMEWAFRLTRQPWRVRRQLALPAFVYQVTKEKLHK